jgi:ribosomal protein S7
VVFPASICAAIPIFLVYLREKTMAQKLAAEIIAAAKEEGAAFKKKEDTLRMAEANKAFSHFRF